MYLNVWVHIKGDPGFKDLLFSTEIDGKEFYPDLSWLKCYHFLSFSVTEEQLP